MFVKFKSAWTILIKFIKSIVKEINLWYKLINSIRKKVNTWKQMKINFLNILQM